MRITSMPYDSDTGYQEDMRKRAHENGKAIAWDRPFGCDMLDKALAKVNACPKNKRSFMDRLLHSIHVAWCAIGGGRDPVAFACGIAHSRYKVHATVFQAWCERRSQ